MILKRPWVGPVVKVVEKGLQGLVVDLVRGLGRIDITEPRPMAGRGARWLSRSRRGCQALISYLSSLITLLTPLAFVAG